MGSRMVGTFLFKFGTRIIPKKDEMMENATSVGTQEPLFSNLTICRGSVQVSCDLIEVWIRMTG